MILKKEILFIFLILGAGYLSFQNSLHNYFVADDFFLIYPYSWKEVLLAFGGEGLANDRDRERPVLGTPSVDEQGNPILFNETYYRPLVRLSAFMDRQIWGFNPFGYHLTNLLLHLLSSVIVYLWIKELLLWGIWGHRDTGTRRHGDAEMGNDSPRPNSIALAVGLLFVTHPVHVEAVTWLSGRVDVLCGFFYLSSILFFTRYLAKTQSMGVWGYGGMGEPVPYLPHSHTPTRPYTHTLALGAFIGALMSKEMAITLPLMVFLIDLALGEGSLLSKFRRLFPFVLILTIYLLFRFILLGGIGGYLSSQGSAHLKFGFFMISILGWYAHQLLLPFGALLPSDISWARYLTLLLYSVPFYFLLRTFQRGIPRRGDVETRGRGDTGTRGRGDTGTWRHGDTGTRGCGDRERFAASPRPRVPASLLLIPCLWIPVTLLPVMNIAAERFLYIPSVGFLLLLGLGLGRYGVWEYGSMGVWEYGSVGVWECGSVGDSPIPPYSHTPILPYFTSLIFLGVWITLSIFAAREKNEWWHRAGEVVREVQAQMKSSYPALPHGAHLFFLDLPDNYRGAYIYRNGIAGSMRLTYQDGSLQADPLISILLLNPETFIKGQHFIFQYQDGKIAHREDLEDLLVKGEQFPSKIGETGVEAPVDIIVQSAGLSSGDLGNIFVNGQNASPQGRGYNVVVVNPQTGEVEKSAAFDTHRLKGDSHRMAEFMGNLESGKIVILALKDEGALSLTVEAVEALKTIGAQEDLRGKLRWSHALIGIKGAKPGEALEASSSGYVKLEVAGR